MIATPDVMTQRLDELLQGLASRPPFQQAIIAVESGDRSFRWAGSAGRAIPNGTLAPSDIPFFIASIDKLLNATVVMKLTESGRLDLDAGISTCLPRALTRGLHLLGGVDRSERITIRHLLGHSPAWRTGWRIAPKVVGAW